jgi:predicted HAD superfamily Cof-like phosphohydrolase
MSDLQKQVIEFHQMFDQPIAESPILPEPDRVRFRARLILEEALEFIEAVFDPASPGGPGIVSGQHKTAGAQLAVARVCLDRLLENATVELALPEALDALGDLDYVVEGTRLEFGVDGDPIAREIHRSNMAKAVVCEHCEGHGADPAGDKCAGCGGKGRILLKRADGKPLKPKDWTPPDIAGLIAKQRDKPAEYGLAAVLVDLRHSRMVDAGPAGGDA